MWDMEFRNLAQKICHYLNLMFFIRALLRFKVILSAGYMSLKQLSEFF